MTYAGAPKRKPIPCTGHGPKRGGKTGRKHKDNREYYARIDILLTIAEKAVAVEQATALHISTSEYIRRLIVADTERRAAQCPTT